MYVVVYGINRIKKHVFKRKKNIICLPVTVSVAVHPYHDDTSHRASIGTPFVNVHDYSDVYQYRQQLMLRHDLEDHH